MHHFYSTVCQRLGPHSKELWELYWNGHYEHALRLFGALKEPPRSIDIFGFEDLLIGHYCALRAGVATDGILAAIPAPPTPAQWMAIAAYERATDQAAVQRTPRPLLAQSEHLSKAALIGELASQTGRSTFIETGTYLGATSYTVATLFDRVDTIEADVHLARHASALFAGKGLTHVQSMHASSVRGLSQLAEGEREGGSDVIVFLDAHYSNGVTSNEHGVCPLLDELKVLFERMPEAILLIDDLRCMGLPGYPTLKAVFDAVPGRYRAIIDVDQLILLPHRTSLHLGVGSGRR